MSVLVDLAFPIHLCILIHTIDGTRVLGTHEMDWRKAAIYGEKFIHRLEFLDIFNPDIVIGIIEARLDLQALSEIFLAQDQLKYQVEQSISKQKEAERVFFVFAREWWSDYLNIRDTHESRLVKLFANYEGGKKVLISKLLLPITSEFIQTPRHAARFVSLLKKESVGPVGENVKSEVWMNPHTFLSCRKGDVQDHAVLLCSFLLGFYLDAYVTLGTDMNDNSQVWVTSIEEESQVRFWDAVSGKSYLTTDEHPFKTIGSCFNQHNFYGNAQKRDFVDELLFEFSDSRMWKTISFDKFKPAHLYF